MFYLPSATRSEMENEIWGNRSLYYMFDETKLLAEEYADEEYRTIIGKWIEDGDETAACA